MEQVIDFFWKKLFESNSVLTIGSTVAAALIFIAYKISILLPSKRERLNDVVAGTQIDMISEIKSSYEEQLRTVTERIKSMDERITSLNDTVLRHQAHLTRLQVLVLQMNGLLVLNGVRVPDYMTTEIDELTRGDQYAKQS